MGVRKIEVQIVGDARQLERMFGRATKSGVGFGRNMAKLAAGYSIGRALVGSVKAAADFEQQLAKLKSVSGASAAELTKLKNAALDTSTKTAFGAREVASAQVELAKAGMGASQILGGALKSTLDLATLGQIGLADAATYTSNAMQAFGLKASQTKQIAVAFASAANATTADVGDFGMALNQTAAASNAAGMSFRQTMTYLTALAAIGVKGSDAGTSLKTTLTQLAKPTAIASKEAKKLGISFFDSNGKMKDAAAISGDLQGAWGKLTQQERLASAARLVGTDGMRTLLAVYAAGPDKLKGYERALGDSSAAQKAIAAQNDTFSAKWKRMTNGLEVAAIILGGKLLPVLGEGAAALAKFVQGARDDGTLDSLASSVRSVLDVVGQVGRVFMSGADEMASFLDVGGQIVSNPMFLGFAAGALAVMAVVRAVMALRAAMLLLAAASVANPFLLFITVAGGLAGAMGLLNSQTGSTSSAMDRLRDAAQRARDAVQAFKDAVLGQTDAQLALRQSTITHAESLNRLADVQRRVNSGELKGREAKLALKQATLDVDRAEQGLKRSRNDIVKANKSTADSIVELTKRHGEERAAAERAVQQARLAAQITPKPATIKARADAEKALADTLNRQTAELKPLVAQTEKHGKANTTAGKQARSHNAALREQQGAVARAREQMGPAAKATSGLGNAARGGAGGVRSLNSAANATPGAMAAAAGGARGAGSAISQGLVAGILGQIGAIRAAAARVALEATAAMKAAAMIKSPSRLTAKEVGEPMADGVAKGLENRRSVLGKKISAVVRGAILDAKGNLSSLSDGLSGMVGSGIDAVAKRDTAALGNSPEAQRLRAMDAEDAASERAAARAELVAATSKGTRKEREKATLELAKFDREVEKETLREQLAAREAAIAENAEKRKADFEQGASDLTDAFNRGEITASQYRERMKELIAAQLPEYEQLGTLLGTAFANTFGAQLAGVLAQAGAIGGAPAVSGSGPGVDVRDPFVAQMQEWKDRDVALKKQLADWRKDLRSAEDERDRAQIAIRDGKATELERRRLTESNAKVKEAGQQIARFENAIKAHTARRPTRLGDGGVAFGPTHAFIGERGTPEAVVPLNDRGISRFLRGAGVRGGSGGVNIEKLEVRRESDIDMIAAQLARRMRMGV